MNKIKEYSELKVCLLKPYLEDVKCWNKEIFDLQVEIEFIDETIDHETERERNLMVYIFNVQIC